MYKIMIVDDESKTRQILHRFVPWHEMGVLVAGEAEDGLEALEMARRILPNIVLTDVRMPKMNGIDFAMRLRDIRPDCKIIFLSAYTDKDYLKFAIKLQAVDYVEKPLNLDEVKRSVRLAVSACDEDHAQLALEQKLQEQEAGNLLRIRQQLALSLCDSGALQGPLKNSLILQAQKAGFPLSGFYACVVIQYRNAGNLTGDVAPERNEQLPDLEKSLEALECSLLIGTVKTDRLIVHLACSDPLTTKPLPEAIADFGETCRKAGIHVFAAMGGCYTDLFSLPVSYGQAAALIHRSFYLETNVTVFHEPGHPLVYPLDPMMPERWIQLLKDKQYTAAEDSVRSLVSSLRQHPDTPVDQTKAAFLSAFLRLNQWIEQESLSLPKIGGERNNRLLYAKLFDPLSSLTEYGDVLIEAIRTFSVYMEHINKPESVSSKIKNIIQERACDPDLSINAIARQLFLTPSYICLVFKNETGMTINRYLTAIRMEKAKSFVADRKVKLYAIAAMIGYTDARHFTGLFKKEVGCTPSEYRQRLLP